MCQFFLLPELSSLKFHLVEINYDVGNIQWFSELCAKIADPPQGTRYQTGKPAKYTFCPLASLPKLEICQRHKSQV